MENTNTALSVAVATAGRKTKMTKFKAAGYDLFRNSEKKVFTYAVIYRNDWMVARGDSDCVGATFHISLEKAEADFRSMNKRSHLTSLEIVKAEEAN